MNLDENKINELGIRVESNVPVYHDGNLFAGFQHVGPGVYRITLTKPVNYQETYVRCALIGQPFPT